MVHGPSVTRSVACLEHKVEQEIEFFCMPKWALAFKVKLPRNKKGVIVAGSRLSKQAIRK